MLCPNAVDFFWFVGSSSSGDGGGGGGSCCWMDFGALERDAYLHVALVQWRQSAAEWLAEIVHKRLGRLLNLQIYNQKQIYINNTQ